MVERVKRRFDFSNPWYDRVTTVGVIVGAALLLLVIALFTYSTRNTCWIGTEDHPGYGNCALQK